MPVKLEQVKLTELLEAVHLEPEARVTSRVLTHLGVAWADAAGQIMQRRVDPQVRPKPVAESPVFTPKSEAEALDVEVIGALIPESGTELARPHPATVTTPVRKMTKIRKSTPRSGPRDVPGNGAVAGVSTPILRSDPQEK